MGDVRVFECAECSHTFKQDGKLSLRCPECRGKTLILLEGPSLRGSKCGGNCGSCSGSCGGCH